MSDEESKAEAKPKDRWDKAQIIGGIVAGIAIPVIIGIAGGAISANLKSNEERAKLIEVGVEILRSRPTGQDSEPIRQWAIEVIDRYSDVKMGPKVQQALTSQPISTDQDQYTVAFIGSCANMGVDVFFAYSDEGSL